MKKFAIIAVKLLVLVAILYWISRSFERKDWEALIAQEKHWGWLGISLLIVLAAHVLSFVRWCIFVHALGVPFSLAESIRLGFLGTLFNLVSLGAVGGDFFKAIAAAHRTPGKRPEVVASVLVDRVLGLLGLLVVAAVSLQLFGRGFSTTLDWIRYAAWVMVTLGVGGFAIVAYAGHRLPIHLLKQIPLVGPIGFRMASAGMLFEGRAGLAAGLLATSCVVHFLLTLGMYAISVGLYAEHPTLQEHFVVVPPAFAAAALPLTPGGVGVQEVAVAQLFEELPSLPAGYLGLIVAAMYRLELIVVAAIGGIYYALGAGEIKALRLEEAELEAGG